jgi:hypothetical protein
MECQISAIAEASLASDPPHRELPSFGNCQLIHILGIAKQR